MTEFALGDEQVLAIDSTLEHLATISDPIDLRFTNHWSDDDESPALLAAALLGSLATKKVCVDAVDEAAVDGLLRFGVATALSRRSVDLTAFVGHAERLDPARLRMLWTPASSGSTNALFSERADAEEAAAYGPLNATFVNPHLSSAEDGHPDVVFLIRRWLTKRLGEQELAREGILALVDATALPVEELVRNVREHAADAARPAPTCLLRLSLHCSDRIRCSIFDTGLGISSSLAAKSIGSSLDASERICRLLAGEIPNWDAGRGTGLAYATALITARGGRLTVATERLRVRRDGANCELREDGFDLQGTVVDFTVPIAA